MCWVVSRGVVDLEAEPRLLLILLDRLLLQLIDWVVGAVEPLDMRLVTKVISTLHMLYKKLLSAVSVFEFFMLFKFVEQLAYIHMYVFEAFSAAY